MEHKRSKSYLLIEKKSHHANNPKIKFGQLKSSVDSQQTLDI